jgi:hypothetical protein
MRVFIFQEADVKKGLIMCAVLVLSACGFHLKGMHTFDRLPETNWQITGGALQQPLEKALRYASGNPVAQSHVELRVLSVDSKRDIYTITRATKLNEYLLSMRVTAQAYKNGQPWGNILVADVRRNMSYSDTNVLGKSDEEAILWQEIQQDVANQIVRQLGYINQDNPDDGIEK